MAVPRAVGGRTARRPPTRNPLRRSPAPPKAPKGPPARGTSTPASIRPKAVDPTVRRVNEQYDPAFKALERQRLRAQGDRDASLRDRQAFDTWARADRERRLGYLQAQTGAATTALAEARKQSDETISSAIERAMARVGGLGAEALGAAGVIDAAAGARSAQRIGDIEATRASTGVQAALERHAGQDRIDRAYGDTLDARARAAFGRRQGELDDAELNLNTTRARAVQDARAEEMKALAKAAEDAWMRSYMTGKQEDLNAYNRAKVALDQRAQDIDIEQGNADRALDYEKFRTAEAAKAKPAVGGYRGRDAKQYRTLYNSWVTRITGALKPRRARTPEESRANAQAAWAEARRQMNAMAAAGVRPRDAVRAVEAATNGDLLSADDYRSFLLQHLPPRNADMVLNELFGTEPVPRGGYPRTPPDQEDRRAGRSGTGPTVVTRTIGGKKARFLRYPDGRMVPHKPRRR